jgi:uncharacterized protein (DUF427 family)
MGQVVHDSPPGERVAVAMVGDREIARSDTYKKVEGNVYFPPASIDRSIVLDSEKTYVCPWKGLALYYDLNVDGRRLKNVAWYYPDPKDAAAPIRDHVVFEGPVKVRELAATAEERA